MNDIFAEKRTILTTIAVVVLAAAAFGWLMYDYGRYSVMKDYNPVVGPGALKEEVEQLRENLTIAQRDLEIDLAANKRLQEDLAQSQLRAVELREELNFYRRIIAPEKVEDPVQVYALKAYKSEDNPALFSLELTLIQSKKRRSTIAGTVRLVLSGEENGKDSAVVVSKSDGKVIKYGYKYFQKLQLTVEVPKDFDPKSIQVDLQPKIRSMHDPVQKTFEWREVLQTKEAKS